MKINHIEDLEVFQLGFEIEKIGNEAITEVKKDHKELGIPLVFSRNGEIFYELSDGTVTRKSPFQKN